MQLEVPQQLVVLGDKEGDSQGQELPTLDEGVGGGVDLGVGWHGLAAAQRGGGFLCP